MTRSKTFGTWIWWTLGAAVGCGGILDVGSTDGSPGAGARDASAGAEATSSAGAENPAGVGGSAAGAHTRAPSGGNETGGVPATGAEASDAGAGHGGDDAASVIGGAGNAGGGAGGEGAGCNCANTDTVTLVDCGGGRWFSHWTLLSEHGDTVLFATCKADKCGVELGRWTPAAGTSHTPNVSPNAMSDDGKTALLDVAGVSYLDVEGAKRQRLPLVPSLLSRDGKVVIGMAEISIGVYEVARWSPADGVIDGTGVTANVFTTNYDGSVFAGQIGLPATPEMTWGSGPFLWNEADGVVQTGELPGGGFVRHPSGGIYVLSDDGTVGAGSVEVASGENWIFRFTQAGGMTPIARYFSYLDDALGVWEFDSNLVLNSDGSVLAGTLGDPDVGTGNPFRYTEAGGIVLLDPENLGAVRGMSADGSVILGTTLDGQQRPLGAFLWDEMHGTRDLATALSDAGADLSGWVLGDAYVLSRDGKVAVGGGTCGGQPAMYRIKLPE